MAVVSLQSRDVDFEDASVFFLPPCGPLRIRLGEFT